MALSRQRPRTWLSSEQGYELARVGTKMGLPVDLQRLIWADVTENYYSRGSVIDRAALVLQVAWRRLRVILANLDRQIRVGCFKLPSSINRHAGVVRRLIALRFPDEAR